ncbi:MAG TPA: TAT-variant-translocated molybdopterin oxidoreductase, partial [Myxococcota bacterium]|nr:TAT-variant-translocated molybdopterin oxidoreductase [Myxococcota bacterium]
MSSLKKQAGKVYWRSLAELADEPEFREKLEREFPSAPLVMGETGSFSRRRFMQLMGASMALASGSACRWEKENILPFTRRPAGHIPGVPKHYATAMELAGHATGLKVTSFDGRPIKIEGNAEHPMSLGGTDVFAQASILELYDPDRSKGLAQAGHDSVPTWGDFVAWLRPVLDAERQKGGAGLRILAEASGSPTLARLRKSLSSTYPQAQWVEYEPLSGDTARTGTAQLFGAPHRVHLQLDRARVILALDDDFLNGHPASLRYSRDFAKARRPETGEMSRLYAVESLHSTTGAMADHRLAVRSEQVEAFLLAVTAEVLKSGSVAVS